MEITVNESEPENSIDRYIIDTTCTGEEALEIPAHWHKVSKGRGATVTTFVLTASKYH